jgi:anti-anti-sigma factor
MSDVVDVFRVEAERQGPNASLYLSGDLDAGTCPSFTAKADEVLDGDCRRLTIFLWRLEHIDLSGLRCLAGVAERARDQDAMVRLVGAGGEVLRMIRLGQTSRRRDYIVPGLVEAPLEGI